MRLLPPPLQGGWWRLFEILFQELNPPATSFVMQKLSAHEVRALATSWTSFKGVSIQEVVQAATWKSQSVFFRIFISAIVTLSRTACTRWFPS